MGIDRRLLEYWRRRQDARRAAGRPTAGRVANVRRLGEPAAEPPEDPSPLERGSNVVPLELEDR